MIRDRDHYKDSPDIRTEQPIVPLQDAGATENRAVPSQPQSFSPRPRTQTLLPERLNMEPFDTEAIDKLFLELSQFSTAKTRRECELERQLAAIQEAIPNIVCTEGEDAGVVLLSNDGVTHYDKERDCQVYELEYFSPLGEALMALHKLAQADAGTMPCEMLNRTLG